MKKVYFLLLFLILASASLYAKDLRIIVDGSTVKQDRALLSGGAVYLPLKVLSSKINATLSFDRVSGKATVRRKGVKAVFYTGRKRVNVNGVDKLVPLSVVLYKESLYIPVTLLKDIECTYRVNWKKGIIFVQSRISSESADDIEAIEDIKDFE